MSNLPEKHIIDKCIDKISDVYINNDCTFEIHPFDCDSREFSITYNGRVPRLTLVHVVVNDGGANRTFIFQVCQDYAHCYADDLMPNKTDHYLYIGEITDCTEKPHILEAIRPKPSTIKCGDQTFKFVGNIVDEGFDEPNSCASTPDPVNHPNHYEMVGPFESFDIIVESLGIDGARQFCQGNIIKYQTRYKEKNGEEDLKKRHWYSRMDQMLAKCKTIEDYYKLKESNF